MASSRQFSPAVSPDLAAAASMLETAPEVHLLDRLAVVFKHLRLIAAVFAIVVSLAMLESYSATPLYRSQARIVIQDERSTAIGTLNSNDPAYWQDPEPYFNTQYRILQSRGLARRVIKLIPPPPVTQPTAFARAVALPRQLVNRWRAQPALSESEAPPKDETAGESAAIGAFLGGLEIAPVKGTRLVEIIYSSPDPAYAALAANTVAREYVQQNLDSKLQNTNSTLDWLKGELDKQRQKVEAAERATANYQEGQNAMSLDDRQNIVIDRLKSLNDAVTKAKTTRLQKEALHRQIGDLTPDSAGVDTFPGLAQNTTIQEIRQQLAQLTGEKARLLQTRTANHPDVAKVNAAIESANVRLRSETGKVLDSIGNDYRTALAEERSLTASLEEQKRQAIDLNRKNINYSILQREAEGERHVYNALLQQEKEMRVISNSRANNVQLMDAAEVPGGPYTPNHGRDWLMALVLGLALGVAFAYTIEYLDDTVKIPDDITRRLKLPLLGLVPAVSGSRVPMLLNPVPHDFGEAFRSLRTSLVFTNGTDGNRMIAVTSSQPLEGKTTTACNLAVALALGGARVMLIDADMRRPGLHRTMGLPNDVGLSHVLTGQGRIRDAVQRTSDPNLYVMTAGRTPPNPSELLSSARMKHLIANLKTSPFDWVIIDTPPVLAVTDAVIVAPYVAGLVFVVGSEMTRRAHAERAIEMIQSGKPNIIGAVLNRVDLNRNKYYYARYYGYHYKNYYGSEAPATDAAA
ncbi:MAG TPA: polysaccharide biosynthesis tyrosine autokinase [Vicinamibacterales bacterium]|nr:polysaccharide biosynthesis tyrosine autokinase [Vicinamibacterales bacterium]